MYVSRNDISNFRITAVRRSKLGYCFPCSVGRISAFESVCQLLCQQPSNYLPRILHIGYKPLELLPEVSCTQSKSAHCFSPTILDDCCSTAKMADNMTDITDLEKHTIAVSLSSHSDNYILSAFYSYSLP